MNFLKKLKDKIHELRQETEKWPEQAQAQVAENMIKSEQSLMKARYEFMNSRLQTKNLPLYKSMDIFLEQFEEKQKEAEFVKEVIAFRDAKDEGGNLLHPHLEELANVMEALKSVNGNSSLEELYQMALYTRPDFREEVIKKEAKRITNAIDVQRAKSVIGVKAQIPAVGAKESKGWKDVLSDSLNE
mgnify:CR=1 FL=1